MTELRQATLCLLTKDNQVLLAMKKRGFAAGKWNGVGGKQNEGEAIERTAIRETQEEIGVTPLLLQQVAVFDFFHPNSDWDQRVVVFTTDKWEGTD